MGNSVAGSPAECGICGWVREGKRPSLWAVPSDLPHLCFDRLVIRFLQSSRMEDDLNDLCTALLKEEEELDEKARNEKERRGEGREQLGDPEVHVVSLVPTPPYIRNNSSFASKFLDYMVFLVVGRPPLSATARMTQGRLGMPGRQVPRPFTVKQWEVTATAKDNANRQLNISRTVASKLTEWAKQWHYHLHRSVDSLAISAMSYADPSAIPSSPNGGVNAGGAPPVTANVFAVARALRGEQGGGRRMSNLEVPRRAFAVRAAQLPLSLFSSSHDGRILAEEALGGGASGTPPSEAKKRLEDRDEEWMEALCERLHDELNADRNVYLTDVLLLPPPTEEGEGLGISSQSTAPGGGGNQSARPTSPRKVKTPQAPTLLLVGEPSAYKHTYVADPFPLRYINVDDSRFVEELAGFLSRRLEGNNEEGEAAQEARLKRFVGVVALPTTHSPLPASASAHLPSKVREQQWPWSEGHHLVCVYECEDEEGDVVGPVA
uniref:Uncharacterized protein n=1 Tax=Chromera velia CCMP2878 TaxID=1169474 RepID=A0A0G4I6Z2_9ALVE|eukprot:Cvel_11548.t1-p1 / transcript=Cvel_11548.t1 / gene=Cvel_11548 / organism=Chromera_velia_CCMP2878 / gene_product=hypothetical protein / transcript_product=hypothetical protein / location=Cvel_scaffold729:46940-49922(-) / protein_length=491 / sequence_SO=supercontig / SO=protein_coding / is_pseudo=false